MCNRGVKRDVRRELHMPSHCRYTLYLAYHPPHNDEQGHPDSVLSSHIKVISFDKKDLLSSQLTLEHVGRGFHEY